MPDQSNNLSDETLMALLNSTPSPASAAGLSPFASPDGPATAKSGPGVAPASPSPRRAKAKAKKTSDTSGPNFYASSPSGDLQRSLESKLRARLDVNGSLEYELTWKHWATESGSPICALRASARRISDNVCIGVLLLEGWPKTPMATDGEGGVMEIRPGTTGKYKLRDYAQLAGRTTPDANAMNDGETLATFQARQALMKAKHGNGNGMGMPIAVQAKLAGWATPTTGDAKGRDYQVSGLGRRVNLMLPGQVKLAGYPTPNVPNGGRQPAGGMSPTGVTPDGKKRQVGTEQIAMLVGWPTTTTRDSKWEGKDGPNRTGAPSLPGLILELFLVPTGRRVVLAPEFSLWLMGFPEAWARAAPNSDAWRAAQVALELECSKDRETP